MMALGKITSLMQLHALLLMAFLTALCLCPLSCLADDAKFGGVGLQVVPTVTGELVVLNVVKNAPADEMGLLPGDFIFKVNDLTLRGSDFGKVVSEHLWGPVGSSVEIFFRRPGVAGARRVVVLRSEMDPRLTVTPTVQTDLSSESRSN